MLQRFGGHPFQLVSAGVYPIFPEFGADASAEEFIRDRKAQGSSFLKIFMEDGSLVGSSLPRLKFGQLRELCRAAHLSDMSVIAHVVTPAMASEAIAAGADGLAHAIIPHSGWDCATLIEDMKERYIYNIDSLLHSIDARLQ